MDSDFPINEVRRQMAEIRSGLRDDVAGIVDEARRLTDWHYYVRSFPWASLAAAAAVGFLVIPKREAAKITPDVETLAQLARNGKLVVQANGIAPAQQKSLVATAVALASTALLRGATNYISQRLAQQFSAGSNLGPHRGNGRKGKQYGHGSTENPTGPAPQF